MSSSINKEIQRILLDKTLILLAVKDITGQEATSLAECSNALNNLNTFNLDSIYRVLCKLDITSLDLVKDLALFHNLTSMYELCKNCKNLTTVNVQGYDSSKITTWSRAFWCTNVSELNFSNLNFTACKEISNWLSSASKIKTINFTNCDLSNCTNLDNFITSTIINIYCEGLKLPEILLKWLGLSGNKVITIDSLVGLLNALPTTTHNYTITLGTYNLNRLADELKAIATNKGWILN